MNLQTQGLIRFTRNYIADWRALMSTTKTVRVADAVAASSAFPPVLAPLRLDLSKEEVVAPEGARFDDEELRTRPVLVDGGVYDNLGLESIWKRCGILIAGYAGHNAAAEPENFTFDQLMVVVNSFLAASIDWRERMLVAMFQREMEDGLPERKGTYWTAGTDITRYPKARRLEGQRAGVRGREALADAAGCIRQPAATGKSCGPVIPMPMPGSAAI